jgi:ubiquinone/menaquinone biosynthesis C-methylase UbiE
MNDPVPEEALEAGRGYEKLFVPALFARWTAHVGAGAGLDAGDRVLDIACGTGVLARHALAIVGDGGKVTGLDPAPGMIAVANEIEPRIDWVLGGAEDLPFDDDRFDSVVSQFGIMFFQDRAKAAREMHRVVRRGGRVAVAAWHDAARNPAYGEIAALLDEQVSHAAGDAVRMPFCLGDPGELAGVLEQAGFEDISFETKVEQARFPSIRTMVEAELRGWLPIFDIHLDEDRIAGVLEESEARLARYGVSSGEAVFRTSAYITTATRPR